MTRTSIRSGPAIALSPPRSSRAGARWSVLGDLASVVTWSVKGDLRPHAFGRVTAGAS